jgi:hypothetical protein
VAQLTPKATNSEICLLPRDAACEAIGRILCWSYDMEDKPFCRPAYINGGN